MSNDDLMIEVMSAGDDPSVWDIDTDHSFTDAGTTPALADNDLIYQITDQSSSGVNLIQTISGSRPKHKIGIVNGKAVTRFDGTDDIMAAGDNFDDIIAGPDKKFAIIVSVANFNLAERQFLVCKHAATSGDAELICEINSGKPLIHLSNAAASAYRIAATVSQITAAPHVISYVYDGSIDTDNGLNRFTIRVDGVPVAIEFFAVLGASIPDYEDTDAQLTVGGFYSTAPATTPAYSEPVDMGRIFMLPSNNISDIKAKENILKAHWGL